MMCLVVVVMFDMSGFIVGITCVVFVSLFGWVSCLWVVGLGSDGC